VHDRPFGQFQLEAGRRQAGIAQHFLHRFDQPVVAQLARRDIHRHRLAAQSGRLRFLPQARLQAGLAQDVLAEGDDQ
jgi:hypothetical protein